MKELYLRRFVPHDYRGKLFLKIGKLRGTCSYLCFERLHRLQVLNFDLNQLRKALDFLLGRRNLFRHWLSSENAKFAEGIGLQSVKKINLTEDHLLHLSDEAVAFTGR